MACSDWDHSQRLGKARAPGQAEETLGTSLAWVQILLCSARAHTLISASRRAASAPSEPWAWPRAAVQLATWLPGHLRLCSAQDPLCPASVFLMRLPAGRSLPTPALLGP